MEIEYIERSTGQRCVEKVYGHKSLILLYGEGFLRGLFSRIVLPLLAHIPFFSHFYGRLQKRPSSARKIASFIEEYGVDASEFAEAEFGSFNEFFTRRLKPECRPIDPDPKVVVMPADGRVLVYPEFGRFCVKGKSFSMEDFLQNGALAHHYREGSMAIIRLCPSDYHRFHFPCDAIPSEPRLIQGPLYSVNPIALYRRLSILAENKRMITELETQEFGTILYIEIGATSVGSIQQTFLPEKRVEKGEEKGYFEFGGSCIVFLFEKGRITFDADLLRNTERGFETRALFGQSLATASSP